jgi:hypothetical protein
MIRFSVLAQPLWLVPLGEILRVGHPGRSRRGGGDDVRMAIERMVIDRIAVRSVVSA